MTSSSPRSIEVTAIDDVTTGNRRQYERYPLALIGELAVADARVLCDINDFSGTGMAVTLSMTESRTELSPLLDTLQQGLNRLIVDLVFEIKVSGANCRVRARGLVVSVSREAGAARVGLKFVRANPQVFEALIRESDRGVLAASALERSNRDTAAAASSPSGGWEVVSNYLSDVLDACFSRCTERLQLNADYAAEDATASQRYFSLVAVRALEPEVRKAFVGEILEDAQSAYLTDTMTEASHTDICGDTLTSMSEALTRKFKSDVLDGLDDRALLNMMARRKRSFQQWLPPGEEGTMAPAVLLATFQRACEASSFQDDALAAALRSFREAVMLYWPAARAELDQCRAVRRATLATAA